MRTGRYSYALHYLPTFLKTYHRQWCFVSLSPTVWNIESCSVVAIVSWRMARVAYGVNEADVFPALSFPCSCGRDPCRSRHPTAHTRRTWGRRSPLHNRRRLASGHHRSRNVLPVVCYPFGPDLILGYFHRILSITCCLFEDQSIPFCPPIKNCCHIRNVFLAKYPRQETLSSVLGTIGHSIAPFSPTLITLSIQAPIPNRSTVCMIRSTIKSPLLVLRPASRIWNTLSTVPWFLTYISTSP